MFCRWCGAENPDDSCYCCKCGRAIEPVHREPDTSDRPNTGLSTEIPVSDSARQTQHVPVDSAIAPLTVVCILLCLVGVVSFFLPVVEATGYNSSTYLYYTITYDGFQMIVDEDFLPGGIYESFPFFARVCPMIIAGLYVFSMYLFYTCFKTRPGYEVPICLFIILALSLVISACAVATPIYEYYPIRETLYNGAGNLVFFWDSVVLLILGYILSEKMRKAGYPESGFFGR